MKNNSKEVRIRTHYATSTKVGEDGKYLSREYMHQLDGEMTKQVYSPTIHYDAEGYRCIKTAKNGLVRVCDMVATCFCKPKPGNNYVLVHKDGNKLNDHYKNLIWKVPARTYPQKVSDSVVRVCENLEVHNNGSIYFKGKKLSVCKEIGDADTDTIRPIWPHVEFDVYNKRYKRYYTQHEKVDTLMGVAGFVSGDRSKFKYPSILHKDNDYLNFNADNLEWVDETDKRYIKYYNTAAQTMNDLGKEINGKRWSDFMNIKMRPE